VLLTRGEGTYTNKIDNWSLGVILYICLVGYPPFNDEKGQTSLEKQIVNGLYEFPDVYWSHVSREAIHLIKRLLCVDPDTRATLEEVLGHVWLRDGEMRRKAEDLMNNNNYPGVYNKARFASPEKRAFGETTEDMPTSSLSSEGAQLNTPGPRIKRMRR
jgi:serine/threonine-protein kinase Chk2